jgi:hypothetical protein
VYDLIVDSRMRSGPGFPEPFRPKPNPPAYDHGEGEQEFP